MTRFRTFKKRGLVVDCAVCGLTLHASRCDILGRYMCHKCGLKSRRYTQGRLLDTQPQLALFLRQNLAYSWLLSMLHPMIKTSLVRFPINEATPKLSLLLPYYRGRSAPHARQANNEPQTHCAACKEEFLTGTRHNIRRFGCWDLCRACNVRTVRQHRRAQSQFDALIALVMRGADWLLPLLHPKLTARVGKHLVGRARFRRPKRKDNMDWV